ncbi:hypothetical protein [Aureimonas sp. SK2]|uniref:hypothetical protein n=1 Tax=Aureimonas sp. SK2 TaxID=3015992 RepID=UPI002443B0EE|nr:hypothetical protein [Aureimonas sp. SK2]
MANETKAMEDSEAAARDKAAQDKADHGGGIGDIGRQPLDRTSENPGQGTPAAQPGGTGGTGLATDADPAPSGENPDTDADETLGTVV